MNILKEFDKEQIELLQEAGVSVENKDYNTNEIKMISNDVLNYIMSKSKNDIWDYQNRYEGVLKKIVE